MGKRLVAVIMSVVAILTVTGCEENEKKIVRLQGEAIEIATKTMTEQYILGEILKQLIEEKTEYQANITKGIEGGTSDIHAAMVRGEYDLYPEYTSSGWVVTLGHNPEKIEKKEMLAKLQKEYHEKYGMTWLGLYGYDNTYGLVVRKEMAEKYGLKNCSDLTQISHHLQFGGNPDYNNRRDGLTGLCEAYGLQFKKVKDIDQAIKYDALRVHNVDVIIGFTTDSQLTGDDIVLLEDDKESQMKYYCSTVIQEGVLEKHPGLREVLMLMDGLISEEEMIELNYQVDYERRDEADVAREFLIREGLITNG